jgi:hypothetical protein
MKLELVKRRECPPKICLMPKQERNAEGFLVLMPIEMSGLYRQRLREKKGKCAWDCDYLLLKNSRIATLTASLLTLVSISCASFGMWRIGTDLDWAGDFVFPQGFLSHWQVWIGAAIAVQYTGWRLTGYARRAIPQEPKIEPAEDSPERVRGRVLPVSRGPERLNVYL